MQAILPTPAEADKIKHGDKNLIDDFYLRNYELISQVAKSYFRNRRIDKCYSEDAINEVYLYFGKLKFASNSAFVRSIKDVCIYVRFGGEKLFHQFRQGNTEILTILDEPAIREHSHGGEVETVGDLIEAPIDILEQVEPKKTYTDEIYKIARSYMSPRQKEAFKYFYYTDLTAREIGAKMGVNINGAQSLKNAYIRKLKSIAEELRNKIIKLGYYATTN